MRLLDQELADAPANPYPEGSELANTWAALQWAQAIRHHRSIVELSRELTRLQLKDKRSVPPQRVRRP